MAIDVLAFLDEVADNIASTLGTTVAGNGYVFVSTLPDLPIDAVAILSSGGPISAPQEPVRFLSTQILVRDQKFSTGIAKAQTIFDSIDTQFNILATLKMRAEPITNLGAMYRDPNNRYMFPLNHRWRFVN